MDPLLKSNIHKSLKYLEERGLTLPSDIILKKENEKELISKTNSFSTVFQVYPLFYKKGGEILSLQQEYFGIYALTTIIKHTLISIPFLKAALETDKIPLSAGILLNYTGAFHLLIAYLALNRRVLVEGPFEFPFRGESENKKDLEEIKHRIIKASIEDLDNGKEKIMAILTRSNKWKYELRQHSHRMIWRELKPIFLRQKKVPAEFMNIFKYLTTFGPRSIEDAKDIINIGIERIVEARHAASYGGYGSDDFAVEMSLDESYEPFLSDKAFEKKLEAYSEFSKCLCNNISSDLLHLLESIDFLSMNRKWHIFMILVARSFECHYLPSWKNSSTITDRIIKIWNWLVEDLFPDLVREKDGCYAYSKK